MFEMKLSGKGEKLGHEMFEKFLEGRKKKFKFLKKNEIKGQKYSKIRNVVSNCYSVEWPCVLQRSSAGTLWDRRTGPSAPWGGYRPTRIPRRLIGRCVVEWKAFCPEKKKTRNFRGIHFNEKRI